MPTPCQVLCDVIIHSLLGMKRKLVAPVSEGCNQMQSLQPVGQTGPTTCFINKVLLGHRQVHSFAIASDCFQAASADLSSYDRDRKAPKPEVFIIWTCTEEVV